MGAPKALCAVVGISCVWLNDADVVACGSKFDSDAELCAIIFQNGDIGVSAGHDDGFVV